MKYLAEIVLVCVSKGWAAPEAHRQMEMIV